jgi:hypothetical protein
VGKTGKNTGMKKLTPASHQASQAVCETKKRP